MELKPLCLSLTLRIGLLLIVPYGIETVTGVNKIGNLIPFNCTLWN